MRKNCKWIYQYLVGTYLRNRNRNSKVPLEYFKVHNLPDLTLPLLTI